jgi:hypothetical protein
MKWSLISGLGAAMVATAAVAADLPVKAPPPAPVSLWQVEIGGRYFWSTGRMRYTLGDPFVMGQTNSQLTYRNMNSNAGETFIRADHSSGFFAKGFLGGGNLTSGTLNDEDFPPAIAPYSNTVSNISNGHLWYGTADIGYNPWQTDRYKVGFFVGYNHFYEQASGFGCTQVAGNAAICGVPIPASVQVLTETQNWDSVRIGVNAVINLMPNLHWTIDAAALPYTYESGYDNHWLRPGINPLPQFGHGWGGQIESVLAYDFTNYFSVGVGGRYWYAETTSGTTQFPPAPGFGFLPGSPTKFVSERYGAFIQASYKFGTPGYVGKY